METAQTNVDATSRSQNATFHASVSGNSIRDVCEQENLQEKKSRERIHSVRAYRSQLLIVDEEWW